MLPLQEDELNLIAENRRRFEDRGILAVVSPVEVLNLCRDKYAFYKYMKGKGTAVLPTYDSISDFEKLFRSRNRISRVCKACQGGWKHWRYEGNLHGSAESAV